MPPDAADRIAAERFLLGAFCITAGLSIFLHGIDFSVSMIGKAMGRTFSKTANLILLAGAGLALGFIISIAEPDLHILAGQVERLTAGTVSKWSIILVVSLGIAALLALGLIRIVRNIVLHKLLIGLYAVVFILALKRLRRIPRHRLRRIRRNDRRHDGPVHHVDCISESRCCARTISPPTPKASG
jgi:hypothetical protein